MSNGVPIRMGDGEKIVAPGEHRTHRYAHPPDPVFRYDELYWNVTGTVGVPIDLARRRCGCPKMSNRGSGLDTGPRRDCPHAEVASERPSRLRRNHARAGL